MSTESNSKSEKRLTLGSLFDGSGGFPLAGILSGIEPKWASEIEPFPIAVTKARFPDMKHYGDVNNINGANIEPVDIITFGSPCFPENTEIFTSDGIKNIQDIKIGDNVLTHCNRFQKVTNVGHKKAETLIFHGISADLECTPNHPIYSINAMGTSDPEWVEAKDMLNRLYAMPSIIGVTCPYEPIKTDVFHYWYRVDSIEYTHTEKIVYNLTVEEDNSYVANGIVVHNCQDMSVAGHRAGLDGERSGLFYQAIRIIDEMRKATDNQYPSFAVWENVCFAKGTLITCEDGYKNIQDVKIGDKVKTLSGKFCSVIENYKTDNQTVLQLNVVGCEKLTVTPNHPFYAIEKKTNDDGCEYFTRPDWIKAEDLTLSHFLGYKVDIPSLDATTTDDDVKEIASRIACDRTPFFLFKLSIDDQKRVLDEYAKKCNCIYNDKKERKFGKNVTSRETAYCIARLIRNCYHVAVNLTANKESGISWYYINANLDAKNNNDFYFDGEIIWQRIQSISFDTKKESVYNLSVEGEHSYGANELICHNCGAFSSNRGEDFREVINAFVRLVEPEAPSVPVPEKGWAYADIFMGDRFSVAYRTLDAQYWGVPQRRKRIYLVADFRGQRAGKVLFESEGLSGYSAESFSAWQRVAESPERRIRETGEQLTFRDVTDCLYASYGTKWNGNAAAYNGSLFVGDKKTMCLNDQGGESIDVSEDVSATLRAEVHGHQPCIIDNKVQQEVYNNHAQKADYDGPLKSAPTITARYGTGGLNTAFVLKKPKAFGIGAFNSKGMLSKNPKVGYYNAKTSRTLDCRGGDPSCNQGGIAIVDEGKRAIPFSQNQRDEVRDLGDKSGAVMAQAGMKQQTYICEPTYCATDGMHTTLGEGKVPCLASRDYKSPTIVAYSLQGSMIGRENKNGPQGDGINENVCFTLNTIDRHAVYALTTGSFLTAEKNKSPTLSARDFHLPVCVCYGIGREAKMSIKKDLQPSITARGAGMVGICHDKSIDKGKGRTNQIGIINGGRQGERIYSTDGPSTTISANSGGPGGKTGLYLTNTTVRRLTPIECARLQGFPSDWTKGIDETNLTEEDMEFWREIFRTNNIKKTDSQIKKWLQDPSSDSAEYKMWGNGIALPCATFVLSGIAYYVHQNE